LSDRRIARGLDYLIREQEADGSWFGRWGVNYLYGTSGALSALAVIAPERCRVNIERGVAWLVGCQNADGGWGETCRSYNDPNLKGRDPAPLPKRLGRLLGLIDAALRRYCCSAGDGTGHSIFAQYPES
jgi:squalene-hopene/tetraprenyl-beta-curcumene cyclase